MNGFPLAAVFLATLATTAAAQDGLTDAASCTLSSTPLAFGRYTPLSAAPSDFTATVTVTCATSSVEPVTVEGQVSLPGDPSARRLSSHGLANGEGELRYQLFLDPARSIPWGDGRGTGRTAPVGGTVSASTTLRQLLTVYGRILARQTQAPVGDYGDDIQVALEF